VPDDRLSALRTSVDRLRQIVSGVSDADLEQPAYPSEWSIADTLSHVGSGAVIMQRRLVDGLAGRAMPAEFAPSVWDEWNAKSPAAKRADALVTDGELLVRLEDVPDDGRESFHFELGPVQLGFDDLVGMRLNEHVLHTWDVEVAADPSVVVPEDLVEPVVDNLSRIARWTAKPTGETRTIRVATTAPERHFRVELTPESATLEAGDGDDEADLTMTSEAFVRLVYGRLDPDHTPPIQGDTSLLLTLRMVFPGP
jgi:uncharacterized protein (TIGR03083 family)